MNERQQGSLPSASEVNPRREGKKHYKAITLTSGKELEAPKEVDKPKEDTREVQPSILPTSKEAKKEQLVGAPSPLPPPPHTHIHIKEENPKIPYPQRLRKNKLESQFTKFLEVFKKLHINIPFTNALEKILSYVKFMKYILSKKRKLGEYETVALLEGRSAILKKKFPPKLKDLGSFTIPCAVRNSIFERSLCDLGSEY